MTQLIEVKNESRGTGYSTPAYAQQTNCLIQFDNGMEYEIQGIYEWNRYNWRRPA
ncbi:hypothetical protein [Egbenema bharatensis]|uniref:hypothetical protein n=1 Tax=Egbenema bharatensis TaxID=3463334 RepID=UPI003A882F59